MNYADFCIVELSPYNARCYSHNYHGPGLRYEIGILFSQAAVVWAHGPFQCEVFNYIKHFNLKEQNMLRKDEKCLAERKYLHGKGLALKSEPVEVKELTNEFRAKHETFMDG